MAVKAVNGAPSVDLDGAPDYSSNDGIYETRGITVFGAPQLDPVFISNITDRDDSDVPFISPVWLRADRQFKLSDVFYQW